ncbi:hypothetical protein NPX99_08600 [Bartonella sp. 220]|uniref:hypothetical protein n=1 Tax=Bartonella sp. 220B TaxID=2967260 RepID=UPI0022A9469B|nr:hypothetical protein [Bartonella sp. 220B]MCZ2159293.1 hypothetical protein [Bartonella sp. 220B]
MREYPEHLNTKQDYLNMLAYDRDESVRRLKALLQTRFHWVRVKELGEGEEGLEDEKHKIDTTTEMPVNLDGDVIEKRYQYELQDDEYSFLSSVDFSVEEVELLIRDSSQ